MGNATPYHVTTSQGGHFEFATEAEADTEAQRLSALYRVEAEAYDSRGLVQEGFDFQVIYKNGERI